MLYIKLFIEREKNIGQSAPECPFNGDMHGVTHRKTAKQYLLSNRPIIFHNEKKTKVYHWKNVIIYVFTAASFRQQHPTSLSHSFTLPPPHQ